jgi:sterol 3beta-glucosyltransferase
LHENYITYPATVSSIKNIKPLESKNPRRLNIVFEANTGIVESIVEFDTDESAQDWRRELLGAFCPYMIDVSQRRPNFHIGALFLYRRNRRLVLEDDTDDLNAIRVNIPLSRVITTERTNLASFAGLVAVTFDPSSHDSSTEQAAPSAEDKEGLALIDTAPERQVLQFGILREDMEWLDIRSYIDKAKTSASSSNVDWPGSRVYIDVDPRNVETSEASDNNLSDRVKSVSYALGLDTTKDIWGTFCLFFFSLLFPNVFL